MQVPLFEQLFQVRLERRWRNLLDIGDIPFLDNKAVEFTGKVVGAKAEIIILIVALQLLTLCDVAVNEVLGDEIAFSHVLNDFENIICDTLSLLGVACVGDGAFHALQGQQVILHNALRCVNIAMLNAQCAEQEIAQNTHQHLVVGMCFLCILVAFLPCVA